jgi:hypothetical protein
LWIATAFFMRWYRSSGTSGARSVRKSFLPSAFAFSKRRNSGLTGRLQNSDNLVTGDSLDLGYTVAVSEDDADLRRGHSLSCEFVDLVADLVGGGLGSRNSIVVSMHLSCRSSDALG